MGVAKYACSGACACDPGDISALRPEEHISVDKYHTVRLTVEAPSSDDYDYDEGKKRVRGRRTRELGDGEGKGGEEEGGSRDCVLTLTNTQEGKKFKLRGALARSHAECTSPARLRHAGCLLTTR